MKIRLFITGILFIVQSVTAWSFNLSPQPLPFSAPDVSFISQNKSHSLHQYKGRKVMLWLFSTWCHTCVAGVKALRKNQVTLEKNGLIILALRNYNNGGYPGVKMPAFMQKFAPQVKNYPNWIIGESSEEMYKTLNAKKFPDVYFLINEKGEVESVDTAPNRNMKTIIKFSREKQ